MSRDWILHMEFNSVAEDKETRLTDPFPCGDKCAVYQELLREWCMEEEDIEEGEIVLGDNTITVRADVLDYLTSILRWTLMHTIPKKVELTRIDY